MKQGMRTLGFLTLLPFFAGCTGALMAQNMDLFGMRGNPLALGQNPAAETDLRFHLSLPGLTTQGNITAPLGQLWGDVGQQLRTLEAPNVGLASATDIEWLGFGWKGKKGYTWMQTGMDVDARFHLDKDLILFGLYGMKDANGVIDPNYVGDFSASDLGMSALGRVALGHQRVVQDKLRLGASLQINRLFGGFQWEVNDWALSSQWNAATQTNSLIWNSDMKVSAFGLIADGAQLDSAMDFPRYLIMGLAPAYLRMLKEQKNSYSLNLGAQYQATERWTLSASATGLPLSVGAHQGGLLHSRSLKWTSHFTYDGYSTGFNPQDTGTWAYYLTNLQRQAVDGFLLESAPPTRFSAPFTLQAAGYYALAKNHRLGLHAARVDRLAGIHQSLGLEYQGSWSTKMHVAVSYRFHRWDGLDGASELSTLVQHRVLPWTTFYFGTNLWLSIPAYQNQTLLLPGNFQSWQVTTGLQVTLFEKRVKAERPERRARNAARQVEEKPVKQAQKKRAKQADRKVGKQAQKKRAKLADPKVGQPALSHAPRTNALNILAFVPEIGQNRWGSVLGPEKVLF